MLTKTLSLKSILRWCGKLVKIYSKERLRFIRDTKKQLYTLEFSHYIA